MTDVLYIYTYQGEIGEYHDIAEVIGIWDNKYELMRYINKDRKEKWNKGVEELTYNREYLSNPTTDYYIYRTYNPELYITEIVKNEGHWMTNDDLIYSSSQENKWNTYTQKRFFEINDEEIWIPPWEQQKAVSTDIEVKKKKDMDKEDRTRFINLFRKFKEQGKINEILEDVNK